jgi:DNA repair exonuclease SbcCD ATPase subunit
MSANDKRQIIDKMFGFSIINEMQRQIKEDRKSLKIDIDNYNAELNQIMDSIESVRHNLNTLVEESSEKNTNKIKEFKDELLRLNEEAKQMKTESDKFSESINLKKEEYEEQRSSASSLKHELDYVKKKLSLYERGYCPTCETKLDSDWHLEKKEEFSIKIKEDTEKIKAVKDKMDQISAGTNELKNSKKEIDSKISDMKYNMKSLKKELVRIKDNAKGDEFEHLNNLIEQFKESEKEKANKRDKLTGDYNFMHTVEHILGEDGVKNLAVKTILPGLNANIAAMAQTMHLHFHIRFDEKFNCIINHLGEDINPMTLSTGERKKADFIIIIAIIKILKLRFPQLNLLFLDELLSSVDHDGIYNILKILSQVIKENKINTFVINHSVLPHEMFDKKIQIYRENGFSKFDVEQIE